MMFEKKELQSSPHLIKGKNLSYMNSSAVAHSGKLFKRDTSFGEQFVRGAGKMFKGLANQIISRLPEEDLLWFARLMEQKSIQSENYFEKYMVVGISDETIRTEQAKGENFKYRILNPSVLFREPAMSRQTSNFNEKKYLIEEDTLDAIADFCFPNGVNILQLFDFEPGKSLDEQPDRIRDIIIEILFKKSSNNMRE